MKVLASNNRAHQGGGEGFGEEAQEIGIFLSSEKKTLRVISEMATAEKHSVAF